MSVSLVTYIINKCLIVQEGEAVSAVAVVCSRLLFLFFSNLKGKFWKVCSSRHYIALIFFF